jgi:murein DD-endopeptidase MepM/ murein hydrolase activator NlpD
VILALLAALALSSAPVIDVPFGSPVQYKRVSSVFGYRKSDRLFHPGIDLTASVGTPVHATADGKVVYAGLAGSYGILVIVDHENGLTTWFGHLSRAIYRVGTRLTAGTVIGRVGMTGNSTGSHLHYEIRWQGVPMDPSPFIWSDTQ